MILVKYVKKCNSCRFQFLRADNTKRIFKLCQCDKLLEEELAGRNSLAEVPNPYRYMCQRLIRVLYPASEDFARVLRLEYFDFASCQWKFLKKILFDFNASYGQPIIHGDDLFVFGLDQSIRLNITSGDFTKFAGMETTYESSVIIGADIYVFGRRRRHGIGCSVKKFSTIDSSLTEVEDMILFAGRLSCAVASDGQFIYAAGGSDTRKRDCASVEEFDLSSETWKMGKPMLSQRSSFVLAVMDGFLYAISGDAKSAERFNLQTRAWEKVF